MLEHPKYAALGNEGAPGFNWEEFEDGWNGKSLKVNKKVKIDENSNDLVFSHEPYAQELYEKMNGVHVENVKDIKKGALLPISDLTVVDDNTMIASVGGGASNVMIDLNKESGFIRLVTVGDTNEHITKEQFTQAIATMPEFKTKILSLDLCAKVGTDVEKGSIWDGYVEQMTKEFKEQIKLGTKAYWAEVLETNGGGFVVEVANAIRAFMPGSMAANNRIEDYESLVGRRMEVMIESWTPRLGFVVSRKKYIGKVRYDKLIPLQQDFKENPDKIYHTKVTGSTPFGVFVEMNEFINGMLHKTLVSDSLREAMRNGTVTPGTEIDVYIHRFAEGGRVILSDVPASEREEVIKRREAEDNQEKSEHLAQKSHAKKQQQAQKEE